MAWQTPKTNWGAADGVRDTDFNRIEGNAQHLYEGLTALRQHVDDGLFAATQRLNISDIVVGAEFALYENGALVPYIKVSDNYNNTGRALVLRKNSFSEGTLQEGSFGSYNGCKVDTFLNNDFINVLDEATRAVLTAVNISIAAQSGTSTISRKIFLLSRTEYNFSGNPVEGSIIYHFTNGERRVASYTGMPYEHWTRTILFSDAEANYVTNVGSLGTADPTYFRAGIRPAFTLPGSFEVVAAMPTTANVLANAEVI